MSSGALIETNKNKSESNQLILSQGSAVNQADAQTVKLKILLKKKKNNLTIKNILKIFLYLIYK